MGLNISKGDMYDFVTHTWNAIKGECPHGCSYCYMHRWGKQRPVRFEARELREFDRDCEKYGPDLFIFVGSSCDMFANTIPNEWLERTMANCAKRENHYLFQTKNPARFQALYPHGFPCDSSLCTTIETNRWYPEVMGNTPSTWSRAEAMWSLNDWNYRFETYVTIEPILDFDIGPMIELIKRCDPLQVNIGADSGSNHLPEPPAEKVLALIDELKKFTTIAKKRNLSRLGI